MSLSAGSGGADGRCGRCSKMLPTDDTKDIVQCVLCATAFHVKCSSIRDAGVTMSAKKKSYNCDNCKQASSLAAARRMAGKKGVAVALQSEVNTEDEWQKLLEKEGLVVVDVYSEWCGPCVGMVGNLKKLKLEIGSDYLHMAVAKSDGIEALKRFRNKSEPTWMFIASGHMVNLMFGANAPRLMRLIAQELDRENKVLKGEREREWISFAELTEEEKNRENEMRRKREIEEAKEAKELAEALEELKFRNLTRWARVLVDRTVILYFPHVVKEDETSDVAYKLFSQLETVRVADTTGAIQVTKEMLPQLFYECEMNFSEKFMENLLSKPCLANLMQFVAEEEEVEGEEEPKEKEKLEIGELERRVAMFIYGQMSNTEPPVAKSFADKNKVVQENGEVWPSLWTPVTYLSKASAVDALFPNLRGNTPEFKEEFLPPPRYCIIFDASRASEIYETIEQFPDEVLDIGFFDSVDPSTAKKVAKNFQQLENLIKEKIRQTKMVLAVTQKTNEPLLAFSQLNPLYISPDTKIGSKECTKFFPLPDIFEEELDEFFEGDMKDNDEDEDDEKKQQGGNEKGVEGGVDVGSDTQITTQVSVNDSEEEKKYEDKP